MEYELKLDGYRALAIKTGGKIRLRLPYRFVQDICAVLNALCFRSQSMRRTDAHDIQIFYMQYTLFFSKCPKLEPSADEALNGF